MSYTRAPLVRDANGPCEWLEQPLGVRQIDADAIVVDAQPCGSSRATAHALRLGLVGVQGRIGGVDEDVLKERVPLRERGRGKRDVLRDVHQSARDGTSGRTFSATWASTPRADSASTSLLSSWSSSGMNSRRDSSARWSQASMSSASWPAPGFGQSLAFVIKGGERLVLGVGLSGLLDQRANAAHHVGRAGEVRYGLLAGE